MRKFYATLEKLRPGEGIVTLRDSAGEWAGSGLVEIKSTDPTDLYEEGYRFASRAAVAKGGTLDRYSTIEATPSITLGKLKGETR